MDNYALFTKSISLKSIGIENATIHYQLSSEELQEKTLQSGEGIENSTGALAINTGIFTGRSPQDRFIVKDNITEDKVWWGKINIPFEADAFDTLYNKVTAYLSNKEVFVRDSYVCADANYRLNVRVVTETAWANLFCFNMFLRPETEELEDFTPEWTLLCVPSFLADPAIDGTRQSNFAILDFTKKIALIGGTGYTGEMKKGIFSALNFILPVFKNTLPMHCSANVGDEGDTAIFFGLSGTGKTTLSADPARKLIGDDEHGWTNENTVFNFEGGCYAKVINLTDENEPDIFRAIKKGAILENVVFKEGKNEVDYEDVSITPNTRVSYPIYHIDNIQKGSIGKNPKNIFFLTADSFGILPPISKLTPGQAAYHFISGYTAKVAGTEAGVTEPQPNFSACFGAPFMPLHPTKYAEMLSKKIKDTNVKVWLINTGWTGGPYGTGSRMKLKYTRAMITAAINGELENVDYDSHPVFGIAKPQSCPNVPSEILNPRNTWEDPELYDIKAVELAEKFKANFAKFSAFANAEIMEGAPMV
ncbi:phosphoenolpyruvate carboxykinase (ATP) [Flavobacterium soyangense]|uniref:Phosphoenolpyruvate carboxykinase (ATP) n=1 Tax=Flavobacterium soyangense TaxID=2023265 RepID=A0A930U9C2_9FLAO|nr:phosphoenolpyruvate carboxykinase (ATP) [Flavobacterium soyangense]MBF2709333.1 phosphoenolpyruvate carboxykinase (ATP) [Flavobacterium soyangense]